MNPYPFFGAIILVTASLGYGFWERGNAESWEGKYNSRVAQEQTAAAQAKLDAAAQEKKDLDALNAQTSSALQLSAEQTREAQTKLAAYLAKGKASKEEDLGHKCFNVSIPADEIP